MPGSQPGGVLVVPGLRRRAAAPVVGERSAEVDRRCSARSPTATSRGRSDHRASSSSTRPTTPGCASWSARRSCRRWSRRSSPTSPRLVDGLLDAVEAKGDFDVIADLASSAAGRGDLPDARRADRGRAASSVAPRRCWRRGSTRSSRSPARLPTTSTSRCRPGRGCATTSRPDREAPRAIPRDDLISA